MQLASVLCAFQLLYCYVILAHPTSHPKTLEKREFKGFSGDTQLHHLHKRMEEEPSERLKQIQEGIAIQKARESKFSSTNQIINFVSKS
ncbi:hypothetical protein PGT21_005680 [Puccinia graminis f. sp. tritici]|uniref:Uncharacterized protein n=1 Tax=Puccinia graminis f. sp. tritici TaxID=56615 RepID=A0A5B0PIP0_PUCGR|nr:hypothetical protein PGT21_005680 [Puccinia graminis f. sp. tritici]